MSIAEWSPFTTYVANDIVAYTGATYISLQTPNLNQNPSTATTFWAVQGGSGVVKITAGANVSISPSGGVGNVTITAALSKQVFSSGDSLLPSATSPTLFSAGYVAPYTGYALVNYTAQLTASTTVPVSWTYGTDQIRVLAIESPSGNRYALTDFTAFVNVASPVSGTDQVVLTSSHLIPVIGGSTYNFYYQVVGTPSWDTVSSDPSLIRATVVSLGPAV
jgi:hypothetical protein